MRETRFGRAVDVEHPAIKFFCDEQLGKLARWLRILGQDALYKREIADEEILARAAEEGRVVLTRDTRLGEKAEGIEVVRLSENYPALQLREVAERYRDRMKIDVFSRCPVDNAPVEPADKRDVKELVPPFVFQTQESFTRCPSCGRVYWKATHHDRVKRQLKDILGELYESDKGGSD